MVREDSCRGVGVDKGEKESYRNSATAQLAFPAKPLTLRNKRHTIAFLVHREVAAVAEDNGVCVFAISIVAYGALAVRLLAAVGLAVDGHG